MLFGNRLPSSLVLATDRLKDQIDPSGQPGLISPIPEKRFDVPLGDIECSCVRQGAFTSITNLAEHHATLNVQDEHRAIATFLLTDAPRLCHALSLVRDVRVALHFGKNCDHDLIRSFPLELC